MLKNWFLICCAVLAVSGLPFYAQDIADSWAEFVESNQTSEPQAEVQQAAVSKPLAHYATGTRTASIPVSQNGHFAADFQMNGRTVHGLIDTGATYVAMNRSTARSLGVTLANSDFKYNVNTANGVTRAALVTINRMEIGPVGINGVDALVLEDSALSATLVGMSFLSKLRSYRVNSNKLELVN